MYAVPQKLFSFVTTVLAMGISPLWPAYGEAIARGDVAWVRRAFRASLWLTLAITIPLCTLLAVTGPWILRIVMGKSLHAPMSLLVVLGVWVVVASVSNIVGVLLNGAGVLKMTTVLSVVASVSNLALSIYLTRRLGVAGVCLGSILTQLLITFPGYLFLLRGLFMSLERQKTESGLQQVPRSA
jgi:O-antigen/teichoic acid export membrane protein